ncbi:succinate dehydrogenase iron-sulfur subunit [Alicyclobacillus cycloheptanicus]|uniref:succinate dehydrogenase n=1 Tax=Alicyclobacillus cycloheptanicus TaxID=1457 RepID=A0ABT9XDM4_9BACL|nr:succinate dehydrogenase iron-sulfur subunit [Alicyclobacillus cycloheptanicus]MDQ0188240.1 succinate dehydrogenase / fumarate reductase iron-sulfur subunit [Alicyclobacillus cycloheptanicus]WDM00967.1 succinate dehydrogenase iron-sulfur subunit [Alicyclobacillus cycloheptanicus]
MSEAATATAQAPSTKKTVELVIERQDGPDGAPYKEEFVVDYVPGMNVIACLQAIQRNPVNKAGKPVAPVTWESNCLEEVCGACMMVINGRPRQACSALVDQLEQPIHLKPARTFPVVRDLVVDRSRMFEALKKVKAWIPIDGTYDLGPGPRMPEVDRQWAYELSRCFTCGACVEACPNVNDKTEFMGAFAISQARLFNAHPTGAMHRAERLEALMGPGGIQECGNAQNCVQVCPKGIPLTTSIAAMNRQVTYHAIGAWLKK